MNPRQFEVWKCKPAGFEKAHWFVIISGTERAQDSHELLVNGLACWSLQGDASKIEVRLNSADGFRKPTVCQCDYFFPLPKSGLHDKIGLVSWERQQQIKARIREILRLY